MAGTLNAARERAGHDRYPEELEAAALQVGDRLAGLGIAGDDAARIGWEIAEHLRREWGGRLIYIVSLQERPDPRQLGLLDSENHAAGLACSEILTDVAEQAEERLAALGMDRDDAARLGWEVAQALNQFWGGGNLYICKGELYEISLRDQEIFRRFNGENHDWLAKEYDLTVQHVYRIVKRVGAAERAKRQAALFT
ncbi:MAG: Mor transcription activator family protein [Thiobacillus sp.]|uniref:Mor transcription activator family protein n=1 Tax=Thiobacillus sp. TaxID=924 RepID=UPI002894B897|nr:Mor transcription activator family protein [Thiobacillus sp.]MDT3707445.1 Mor transcription activator family protein [Thiobacillus sp.]